VEPAETIYSNPVFNSINTKTVTKLVLLVEIVAICILHMLKLNQPPQTGFKTYKVVYNSPKKVIPINSYTLMHSNNPSSNGLVNFLIHP